MNESGTLTTELYPLPIPASVRPWCERNALCSFIIFEVLCISLVDLVKCSVLVSGTEMTPSVYFSRGSRGKKSSVRI